MNGAKRKKVVVVCRSARARKICSKADEEMLKRIYSISRKREEFEKSFVWSNARAGLPDYVWMKNKSNSALLARDVWLEI